MTKLSEHFTLEELTFSATAQRKQIDNKPPAEVLDNMKRLAAGLEEVRAALGNKPMRINSGYRSPKLNRAVGGARLSAHMAGYAADFVCPDFGSPLKIVKALAATGIQFDKLIQEGTWVHISFAPEARRQLLTAHFGPNGTSYTAGV
jgi:hypothetical protein